MKSIRRLILFMLILTPISNGGAHFEHTQIRLTKLKEKGTKQASQQFKMIFVREYAEFCDSLRSLNCPFWVYGFIAVIVVVFGLCFKYDFQVREQQKNGFDIFI